MCVYCTTILLRIIGYIILLVLNNFINRRLEVKFNEHRFCSADYILDRKAVLLYILDVANSKIITSAANFNNLPNIGLPLTALAEKITFNMFERRSKRLRSQRYQCSIMSNARAHLSIHRTSVVDVRRQLLTD